MKKYPKLRYPGEKETRGLFADGEVFIQEKLDGANFRFKKEDEGLKFGSRRTEGDNLQRQQFEDSIEFVTERVNVNDVEFIEQQMFDESVVFFGEAMLPHTLSYNWEETPDLVGFDVWLEESKKFAEPHKARKAFEVVGVPFAPILDVIEAENWDEYDFEVPQSAYASVKAEGVVFKNPTTGVYGKYVREDFKEKNKQTFGPSSKSGLTETENLVYEYITEARIEKQIYKLRDEEGKEIRMEMMADGKLPQAVIEDFIEEEGVNVFMNENKEVDIEEFRSIVSSRCAEILRRVVDKKVRENL